MSKLVGEDVRGFKHAASNQSMRHALRQHGDYASETARGQKALTERDLARIPDITREGVYRQTDQRPFGPRRVEVHATIEGDRYVYVAEIRRKKRRIDMVTMWKK
ncbi:hypothetical protein ASF70_15845 [Rhizobium sp. Leaf321]|nr:hypothetical protein ASF70_15845 [Rhizobium sp. Leaf321]